MADEKTNEVALDERVHAAMVARLGHGNGMHANTIRVEMRAAELYWVLRLAMWGLDARRAEFKAKPAAERDAGDLMSVASWGSDLETFADALAKVEVVKPARGRTGGK